MTTLKERFKNEITLYQIGWSTSLSMRDKFKTFFRQELLALANEVDAFEHTDTAAHFIRSKADELK